MQVDVTYTPGDEEGVWVPFPGKEGVEFLIARAGNKKFLAAVDKHERPFRKQENRGTLPTETKIDINCRAMADGILLGWKGLTVAGGGTLEYTKESAFAVLRFNENVREFVAEQAGDRNLYRQEDIDETAKK